MTKRLTKSKQALWKVLQASTTPIGAPDIIRQMADAGTIVNKTTVYRELDALLKEHKIIPVELGDRVVRYEPADRPHHHHLVCIKCEHIEDVAIDGDMASIEKKIARKKKFQVVRHQLEFFGLCQHCRV